MLNKAKFLCLGSIIIHLALPIILSQSVDASERFFHSAIEYYQEYSDYFTIQEEEGKTTITISDNDLSNFLQSKGVDMSLVPKDSRRGVGVTKIVWHGKATNGNVDIYFSKTWLNNMSKMSYGFVYGALGALLGPVGGGMIGAIASIVSGGNFTHGRVFIIRKFIYQYYYLQ
jgi:hypothetical protein